MNDWKSRAEREAAAILDGWQRDNAGQGTLSHARLVNLIAGAWMQGAIFASHLDLSALEIGVDDLRAAR